MKNKNNHRKYLYIFETTKNGTSEEVPFERGAWRIRTAVDGFADR